MPETRCEEKRRDKRDCFRMLIFFEKFFCEEIYSKDGENAEKRTRKAEHPWFRIRIKIKENFQKKSLNVDEHSFSPVVFRIKYLVGMRGNRFERIISVHRLIGIEPGRGEGNVVEAEKGGEEDNAYKDDEYV